MRQKLKFFFFVFLVCSLYGCGFHLRHQHSQLGAQYPTMALPFSGSQTLHQALYHALKTAKVRVVNTTDPQAHFPILRITAQTLTQQPLVYGPESELRRERLKMRVSFSFGVQEQHEFTLATERDRQLISSQHLGDNAEKTIIEQEMQNDIVYQLIRYLEKNKNALLS